MAIKKKYKFKELKCYKYADWLANEKRYSTVFIDQDTDWISGALTFYNILFDEEPWSCKVRLKCVRIENGNEKEIFNEEADLEISTDQNIVTHRDGWGNKNKTFWKKGIYKWIGYIDGVEVGEKIFYVEDGGLVTQDENPYFDIQSIKFYESEFKDVPFGQRRYLTQFKNGETRFVNTELAFRNKKNQDWQGEFTFQYYDQNGQLKGLDNRVINVQNESEYVAVGYGTNDARIWYTGDYTLHLLFMGVKIAVVPFSVGIDWVEGDPTIVAPSAQTMATVVSQGEPDEKSLNELLDEFDELIGLNEIKSQIRNYIGYLQFEKLRADKGLDEKKEIKLHAVLTGNPGTGKTTVAKKLGKIYKALGLLSKGHVHEVDRADLIGEYIGHTAPKTKQAIELARGGILFIDEAYSLSRDDSPRDFGHEAIEVILKEMSDGKGDLMILVAGYPAEMNHFINSNPGLRSRFKHYFTFPDYVPTELMEIADLGLKKRNLVMKDDAREFLLNQLTRAFRDRDRSFGNARYVMSLIDESKMNLAIRVMQRDDRDDLSNEELTTVTIDDVEKIFTSRRKRNLSFEIDTTMLQEALYELDTLIGMDTVKGEIKDLVKLVKYYHEIGKDVLNQFVLHTIFIGNPGTGKTTVARIYAKIFKALGIIERGHLVEADREALVSGHVGQTSIKTAELVDKAIGGVLFIDEAYALRLGDHDEFGNEAINTLLKRMEDRNKEFIVVAAGYPDNMVEFLHSNPGLSSRFERTIKFEDYNPQELMMITDLMLSWDDLKLDNKAKETLQEVLDVAYSNKDKYFGNGRFVRNIVQKIVQNHSLRMANLPEKERTSAMIRTVSPEDLRNLPISTLDYSKRRSIGF